MEAMLGRVAGLQMISAPLPTLGLQMAVDERPDLVLLDIQLPGMDGYEVLRRLRLTEAGRQVPVIAVSANAMAHDVEHGLAAGFVRYLTKPLDMQELLAAVEAALARASVTAGVRVVEQLVGVGDGDRREQEGDVDDGLPHQHLGLQAGRADETLQQVDRADADDGGAELDLQHRRVHVAQPFGFVAVAFQVHAADEGFVAADDHHDQQVGDHHHVDQRQHGEHDHGFGQLRRLLADHRAGGVLDVGELVAHAVDQRVQRGLVAEGRFDQVNQLDPEMEHVDTLRQDQPDVERQLQPAAHEDEVGQGPQLHGRRRWRRRLGHEGLSGIVRLPEIVVAAPSANSPSGGRVRPS